MQLQKVVYDTYTKTTLIGAHHPLLQLLSWVVKFRRTWRLKMERYLFRKRKENQLMKFVSLPFGLACCVVVLESLGSEAPIIGSTTEQAPQQVMEKLNSTFKNIVSSRFTTFWPSSLISNVLGVCTYSGEATNLNSGKDRPDIYSEEIRRKAGRAGLHMIVKHYSFKMEKREKKRLDKSLRESIEEIGLNPSRWPKPMGTVKLIAMKSTSLLL